MSLCTQVQLTSPSSNSLITSSTQSLVWLVHTLFLTHTRNKYGLPLQRFWHQIQEQETTCHCEKQHHTPCDHVCMWKTSFSCQSTCTCVYHRLRNSDLRVFSMLNFDHVLFLLPYLTAKTHDLQYVYI